MNRKRLASVVCVAVFLLLVGVIGCRQEESWASAAEDAPAAVSSEAAKSPDSADVKWTEGAAETREINGYQGLPLDTYFREYDNSIRGPQEVDIETYRLEIVGLVEKPLALTYDEVLALPRVERAITLRCVEGWKERLLFEGVRLSDLLALAQPKKGVTTLVLHAIDGYSTGHEYENVERLDMMLAYRINGRVLDEMRGFPFQLVAESKLGYKWIKWVNRIELTDEPYLGFWESRGYGNEADVPEDWLDE